MAARMNLQRFRMSPPKKEGMPIPHISKLFVMCISQKCKGVAWMSHRHVFFLTTDRSRAGGSQPMLITTLCRLLRRPGFREGLLEEDFLRRRSRGRGRLRDRSGSRERTVCLDEVALDPCVPDGGATLSAFRKETTSHSSPLSEVFCATAMSRSCFISLA